ncbi:MAG: hypothetical protein ACE5GO_01405 [Anaerolineales bacterium]
MRTPLLLLTLLILGLLLAASCTGGPSDPSLAPYNAQVTLTVAAIQATNTQESLDQHQAATKQAERETQQALDEQFAQATLSAAKTQDAIRATQDAENATATAEHAAYLRAASETAQAQTATAQAQATQTAWPLIATPLAATQNAVVRADREGEMQSYWNEYVIPARVILPTALVFIIIVLLIVAAVMLYPRLSSSLEALEMLLRTHKNRDGAVDTIVIHGDQNVRTVSPQRALGHATRNTPAGVLVDRTPDGAAWQDGVISREQMIRLFQAAMHHQQSQKRAAHRLLKLALANNGQEQPVLPDGEEIIDAEVVILSPDDPEVYEILSDIEPKLMSGDYPS